MALATCCAISSTMSASRTGIERQRPQVRPHDGFPVAHGISRIRHADPRNAVERRKERAPAPALGVKTCGLRRSGDRSGGGATPASSTQRPNQAAAFEAVERRIERRDVKVMAPPDRCSISLAIS